MKKGTVGMIRCTTYNGYIHHLLGVSYLEIIIVASSNDDIVDFQNHSTKLGR